MCSSDGGVGVGWSSKEVRANKTYRASDLLITDRWWGSNIHPHGCDFIWIIEVGQLNRFGAAASFLAVRGGHRLRRSTNAVAAR
eukprot:CAMPEP_0178730080 /NCGR_PEP_ID=MMETSP0699-20121125/29322_1 /TAXON_ID=265572 /ORGANISM="Extubocellulus spinifer, Strain CCMP396" /LENGTH=83 /DNA_ID=CAMNT_0020382069 /DNA_START=233 /DNA_END=481 /DNA_ORIENTATION=+